MITTSIAPTTTTVEGEHTTWSQVLGQDSDITFEVTDSLLDWEPEGWYWPAGSIGGRFTSPEPPVVDVLERCVQG